MENNSNKITNDRNRESARIVAGLLLVGVGAAFLLRNMGFILPHWLFTWPIILILAGIYSGVKHNFSNFTWLILIGIGGAFLAGNFYPGLNIDRAFWPVAIIALGVMFILRPRRERWNGRRRWRDRFNDEYVASSAAGSMSAKAADSSDFLYVNSVFSGVNKSMMSKNFQGGSIRCVFGGAEIDFMQADINGTAELKVELLFGGAKIIVPANWTIVNEIDGMFHEVDDKRKNSAVLPDPKKILLLKGNANFGGMDVRSY